MLSSRQCGLAPGFISIAAYDLAKKFDKLRDVQMRVGALPVFPHNALKYNLTWSTDGLINEYCNPCESIRDGVLSEVPALEELEQFTLDGVEYEAFNTSGGLGTLCETPRGQGREFELQDRALSRPTATSSSSWCATCTSAPAATSSRSVLETAIPITYQDVVLVFVTVNG